MRFGGKKATELVDWPNSDHQCLFCGGKCKHIAFHSAPYPDFIAVGNISLSEMQMHTSLKLFYCVVSELMMILLRRLERSELHLNPFLNLNLGHHK